MKLSEVTVAIGASFAVISGASAVEPPLDDWITQNLAPGEALICKRESGGEYFFVARARDRVKLASSIDMTSYSTNHAFLLSWAVKDRQDQSVVTKERPVSVRDSRVQSGDAVFAESIEFRKLVDAGAELRDVVISIKKCPTAQCEQAKTHGPGEKEYSVKICDGTSTR